MYSLNRNSAIFVVLLLLISLLGFTLRLVDYDRIPGWRESDDEIHYAWTGLTWLKSGIPESWSNLEIYENVSIVNIWNANWRLVKPILEKPPLYSLISGLTVLLIDQTEFHEVRLSTIRLLPLFLSLATIFLTGILSALVFGKRIGLISALLYAVIPTTIMSNRLSVTENLLTPLALLSGCIFILGQKNPSRIIFPVFIGVLAGLAALTKQSGVSVIFAFTALYFYQKQWKQAIVCTSLGLMLFAIYPLLGLMYDWQLFIRLLQAQRVMGNAGGLPQLLITILGRPLITTERLFYDGTILFGLILLFTSPWWLFALNHLKGGRHVPSEVEGDSLQVVEPENTRQLSIYAFLAFPLIYTLYLGLTITGAEPIGSGQGFWGWYAYPLFPYTVTLVTVVLYRLWNTQAYYLLLIAMLILGSSTVRFLFLQLPRAFHFHWQKTLIGLFIFSLLTVVFKNKLRQLALWVLFLIFIGVNIYTSLFLYKIYPSLPQPLP